MKIRNIDLGDKPVLLAPMEDVTDPAFRLLCKEFGADMVYTEFVSSDALIRSVGKTMLKLNISDAERPVAIQIYGKDTDTMVEAARIVEQANPDILDLNFGCPVKRVAGKGAGSGMLQNVPKMLEITKAVVDAVKIPVTVKTRLGWDAEHKIIVELAEQLQMQRSNLSTLLNELVADGKMEKLPGRPVHYRPLMAGDTPRGETSCFKILDSCEGSLRPMIQMAKAAILYPDHSLNTLIEGPSGSGKTTFGYLMYQFACENKVLPMGAPFERFSCHYYDDQEEKAYSRLFGAGEALEKAKGGMLFLDNVEYLPVGCREHLLDLIENDDAVLRDIILVCSLQDKARASVKDAYTARFSARIELQPLQNWQLGERFALVQQFLINEAVRMKRTVRVNAELLHCLCLYRCENNVKQFKNDIRLGCANAYLRAFHADEKEELPLYLNDFPSGVQRGLLYYKTYRKQLEELIPQGYAYTFSADSMHKENCDAGQQMPEFGHPPLSDSVYDIIDRKGDELRQRGIGEEDISRIINAELEYDMKQFTSRMPQSKVNRESLYKVMDRRIVDGVDALLKQTSRQFNRVYPESTFYGLCLHLSSTLERRKAVKQRLSNERILDVVQNHREEYAICMQFASAMEKELGVPMSIDEAVLLTLFLCEGNETHKAEDGPVVLIAMHGDSTASSVADVVNSLAGCGNTYAYDMPLDKDMQQACDELKAMIQELDRGQGILLLYDMGSLRTMAEVISKETGVQIRTVAVPGTLIAVDCSRKAASASSLEELHEDAMGSCRDFYTNIAEPEGRSHHKNTPVIITLCMTGEGGAVQMKSYLEKNAGLNGIQVIPLSISDRKALLNEVNRLREEHEIRCVIGTYDPGLHGIPFISVVKLFETPADKLDMLLTIPESDHTPVNYEMIFSYLSSQMPALDIKKLRKSLPRALAKIKRISAEGLDQNQELGLFLHIACAIDRLQNGEAMPEKGNRQGIISRNKRLYNDLREILSGLEETFDIRFSDDELAYMIAMVKKL